MPQDNNLISNLHQNTYFPFITVSIGAMSLTWDSSTQSPDYFISLSHTRMVDQANRMSLNITFCPQYNEDPNMIEEAIYNSLGICVISYGNRLSNLSPRVYKARILGYKTTMTNGSLSYSLSLVSAITQYNQTLFTYPPAPYNDKGHIIEYPAVIHTRKQLINAIRAAARVLEPDYTITGLDDLDTGSYFLGSEGIEFDAEKVSPVNFIKAALKFLKPITVADYQGELLPGMVSESEKEQFDMSYYTLSIDDSCTGFTHYSSDNRAEDTDKIKGTINIIKIDPNSNDADNPPSEEFTFYWGTQNSTVIDWSIDFDGSTTLPNTLDDSKYVKIYQIDPFTGKPAYSSSTKQTTNLEWVNATPEVYYTNLIKSHQDFKVYASYAYQARLSVLGENQKSEIGKTKLQITPIISGKSHHSAGIYTVIGMTDEISSRGFTTTYSLIRNSSSKERQLYVDKLKNNTSKVYKRTYPHSWSPIDVDFDFRR